MSSGWRSSTLSYHFIRYIYIHFTAIQDSSTAVKPDIYELIMFSLCPV